MWSDCCKTICKIQQLALAIITFATCKTAVGDLGHHPAEISAPDNTCTTLMRTVLTCAAMTYPTGVQRHRFSGSNLASCPKWQFCIYATKVVAVWGCAAITFLHMYPSSRQSFLSCLPPPHLPEYNANTYLQPSSPVLYIPRRRLMKAVC